MMPRNKPRLPVKLDEIKTTTSEMTKRDRREFTRLAHKKQRQYNHKLCREAA